MNWGEVLERVDWWSCFELLAIEILPVSLFVFNSLLFEDDHTKDSWLFDWPTHVALLSLDLERNGTSKNFGKPGLEALLFQLSLNSVSQSQRQLHWLIDRIAWPYVWVYIRQWVCDVLHHSLERLYYRCSSLRLVIEYSVCECTVRNKSIVLRRHLDYSNYTVPSEISFTHVPLVWWS